MKKYTYENGYAGKIEYWSSKLVEASKTGDIHAMEKAQESLNYFVGRHLNFHGAPRNVNNQSENNGK
jgi:hypothetical protein